MKNALVITLIGIILCSALGVTLFQFTPSQIALAVLASNIAAFVGVMVTIRATQDHWFGKAITGSLKTWLVMSVIYFGLITLIDADLREIKPLVVLAFPLILSTGFAVIAFGWIQDRIVRARYLRGR